MMPPRLSRSFQMLATFVGHTVSHIAQGLRTRLGPRRALMAATYALLLVSCDSPFAPDDQTVARLEVNPLSLAMTVGDARTITVRVLDDAGKALDSRQTLDVYKRQVRSSAGAPTPSASLATDRAPRARHPRPSR